MFVVCGQNRGIGQAWRALAKVHAISCDSTRTAATPRHGSPLCCVVFCLAAIAAVSGVRAAEVTFPNADGSGDMSLSSAWGSVDYTGADIKFGAGTYRLSGDFTAPLNLYQDNASGITLFDFSSSAATFTVSKNLMERGDDRTTEYRGGTWYVGSTFQNSQYGMRSRSTTLFNGVSFSCNYFADFSYSRDSEVVVSNSARVTVRTQSPYLFQHSPSARPTATNNSLRIVAGGVLSVDRFYFDHSSDGVDDELTYGDRIVVSGAGSRLEARSASDPVRIGYKHGGNAMRVENGGWFGGYQLQIGCGPKAGGNTLVIAGEGSVVSNCKAAAVGYVDGAHSNSVYVLDGGALSFNPKAEWAALSVGQNGSSYNTFVLSNGTLRCRYIQISPSAASHDNRLLVYGTDNSYDQYQNGAWPMFGAGYGSSVIIDGGAKFAYTKGVATFGSSASSHGNEFVVRGGSACSLKGLCSSSRDAAVRVQGGSTLVSCESVALTNTTLEVSGGSTLVVSNSLSIGDAGYESASERCFVGSGATLSVMESATLYSDDSEIVVSNGTLKVNGAGMYGQRLTIGASSGAHPGTNSTLVLQGDSPCVTHNASDRDFILIFTSGRSPCLRFEIPPQGYAQAPLRGVTQVQHGNDFRIEFSSLDRIQRTLRQGVDIPLVDTTSSTGLLWLRDASRGAAALAAANARLPRGCVLKIVTSGGSDYLRLHVTSTAGTLVTVR